MEFFELRMNVTVNKCATLKINICIYLQQTLKLQTRLIRFKTSLRSTGAAINTCEQGESFLSQIPDK